MRSFSPDTPTVMGKAFVGSPGTTIPNSVNPAGDYTTILTFQSLVSDKRGDIIDLANNRLLVPHGFAWCRVLYNMAFAANATGWRGCRIKNSAGNNYGNVRIVSVGAGATTNVQCVTSWLIVSEVASLAPDQIQAGSYFELYPAQTSGGDLVCGADTASSFVQIEFAN
jgi:hypothetical protein